MIQIHYKGLEKSEIANELVRERLQTVEERFPDLKNSFLKVTLSMENSPLHAGPDVFTVKIFCPRGRYKGVLIEKSAQSLYLALALVIEHMLELLNRFGDKRRVRARKEEREIKSYRGKELKSETESA